MLKSKVKVQQKEINVWEYYCPDKICQVWDSSRFLMELIALNEINVAQKVVLDFSCGTGVLGAFSLANSASKALFSDINDPQIQQVVLQNITSIATDFLNNTNPPNTQTNPLESSNSRWEFKEIDWIDAISNPSNAKQFTDAADIVFMSDLFYDESFYDLLFCMTKELFAGKEVFIAYQERGNSDPIYAYAANYNLQLKIIAHSLNLRFIDIEYLKKEIYVFQVIF